MATVVIDEIRKSAADTCSYRALELQNQLKVLLISDPDTDKAAAGLTVQVGYMCDPWDLPGLAHFCEHMILLGTKKYPAESQYELFLSSHGGQRNAMTCSDETCFYFDITTEHLREALDIFAQFFREPLFDENCMVREKNAIDNENAKNIKRDVRRVYRVNQVTTDPKHDFCKFGTGNMETLSSKDSAILREQLLNFHKKWYSSNIMSLAVLGKESLDQLMAYVVDLFSSIPNLNIEAPRWPVHPFSENFLQLEIKIMPVDDIHKMVLSFPTPDLSMHYNAKPDAYVSYLLSHTGQGGLISYLKSRNWVVSGEADLTEGARGISFFRVAFTLSAEGMRRTDEVIMALFQYIKLMQQSKPQEYLFRELSNLAEMAFRFMPKQYPIRYVQRLCRLMHKYAWKDVLCGPHLAHEFKPDLIEKLIACLIPEKVRIILISKQFQGQTDQEEKYYGARYSVNKIAPATIEAWKKAQVNEAFKLPVANNFIATNFTDVPVEKDFIQEPKVILNDQSNRIWFMQDTEYHLPRCVASFEIRSPVAYQDALSDALIQLAIICFRDHISGPLYPARMAGLNYAIINHPYGISFKVSGYSEKLQVLLEDILGRLASYKVDPARFEVFKDLYARRLKNFDTKAPFKQAMYFAEMVLSEKFYTYNESLEILDKCTPEACNQLLAKFLQNAYIESFVHGSMSMEAAKKLALSARSSLKCGPLENTPNLREVHLSEGQTAYLFRTNSVQPSSAVLCLYQVGVLDSDDLKTSVLNELLCRIVNEPVFTILRTKEQLGYIVLCDIRFSYGTQGLVLLVQSNLASSFVLERMEEFMKETLPKILRDMTTDHLEQHKKALIMFKLAKPKTLEEKTRILWDEVCCRYYLFDRNRLQVEILKSVAKSDLISFYERYIASNGPDRKQLVVTISSQRTKQNERRPSNSAKQSEIEASTIKDIDEFKQLHGFHPRKSKQFEAFSPQPASS